MFIAFARDTGKLRSTDAEPAGITTDCGCWEAAVEGNASTPFHYSCITALFLFFSEQIPVCGSSWKILTIIIEVDTYHRLRHNNYNNMQTHIPP